MTKKRVARYLLPVLAATTLLMQAAGVFAAREDAACITTGRHQIGDQNIADAKNAAVKDALEQAVQSAFTTLVSQQELADNLDYLYDQVLANAMDYVATYRVINGIEHNGEYLVGVESKISLALMEKRLQDSGVLNQAKNNPVVLLFIAEQGREDMDARCWWLPSEDGDYVSIADSELKQVFAQAHIPLAVDGDVYPDPAQYNVTFASLDDPAAAMALGQALNADMVIVGRASAQESFNRMGDEKTFEAGVALTALDLATQKEIARTSANATAKSIDEEEGISHALIRATDEAGLALKDKISAFWAQAMKEKRTFDLYVEGERFLTRFIALKRQLKDIRGIEDISPRELGSTHAIMDVSYKGTPKEFADAVMLKTFDAFGIDVSMISENAVKIRFVNSADTPELQSQELEDPARDNGVLQQGNSVGPDLDAPKEIIQEKLGE